MIELFVMGLVVLLFLVIIWALVSHAVRLKHMYPEDYEEYKNICEKMDNKGRHKGDR